MDDIQETESKVSAINKTTIAKAIVKFCGNEGQGDETGLRRLLQAVIDHIPKEKDQSVWKSAEIEMYDWNYKRFVITSGKGECKFFVNYDKSGSPNVMRELRGFSFSQLFRSFFSRRNGYAN